MNTPERMSKCRIIAAKNEQAAIINTLYDLGLYHVQPHSQGKQGLDIGKPLERAEELASLIVKLRRVLSAFPSSVAKKNLPELTAKNLPKITKGITKLYHDFTEYELIVKNVEQEKKQAENLLHLLKLAKKQGIEIAAVAESKLLTYFAGTVVKPGLQERWASVPEILTFVHEGKYIIIVCKTKDAEVVYHHINEFGFNKINTSQIRKNVGQEIALVQKQEKVLEEKLKKNSLLQKRIISDLPTLQALEEQLQIEIKKQQLPLHFAVTKSSFIAEGWVPRRKVTKVEQAITEAVNEKVHVEFSDPDKKDLPPVKLSHKRLVTPFEFLLRLYDLPSYKEIDPTSIFFITFPLFFGFMLGDVGYGLVLLLAFYYLKKKVPAAAQLASVLLFAAVVSVIFGFVFGEYFGFEHVSAETGTAWCDKLSLCLSEHMIESHGVQQTVADFPRLINRAHEHIDVLGFKILTVLVIGAIVGFIHVNLGFLLGFVNELMSHGLWHAITAKLSWIIIEIGIIILVLAQLQLLLPIMLWLGIVIAIGGLVLLGIGEGIQGFVELPGLISNMLSYMRLGAVGLASVGLAVVVNENLAMPFIERGGFFVIIGLLIMLLGHGINILLGVIGPFLHGVRLHYVELFSKFFHGGGVEYTPFSKTTIVNGLEEPEKE